MLTYLRVELEEAPPVEPKGRVRFLIDGEPLLAEQAAARHYEKSGYHVVASANSYWWTLMSLLFWDAIFAKVRGAVVVGRGDGVAEVDPSDSDFSGLFDFTVTTNGMPQDFFSPEFFQRRRAIIDNRMKELHVADLTVKLTESYNAHRGQTCRAVEDWSRFSLEQLQVVTSRLDKVVITDIMYRLLSNFSEFRSGLPDLLVYNDTEMFLCEVKSSRDKLSEKQREWHRYLSDELGLRIELLLISHSDEQLKRMQEDGASKAKEVTITFGRSSSYKRDQAIKHAQAQASFFTEGDGKDQIHGAKFRVDDIENLYAMLDLTSGWKTQRIVIDGKEWKSMDVRGVLYCFREKVRRGVTSDYCRLQDYGGLSTKLGCHCINFYELDNNRWEDYGFVDTKAEEWIFALPEITQDVEEIADRMSLCPLFDAKRMRAAASALPARINPKTDSGWAFIDNEHRLWYWDKDTWTTQYGEGSFPGMASMVGVAAFSKKDRADAARLREPIVVDVSPRIQLAKPVAKSKACFVATVVYGDPNAEQLAILRSFRDKRLARSALGRSFVRAYYRIGPQAAAVVSRSRITKALLRRLLDSVLWMIGSLQIVPHR